MIISANKLVESNGGGGISTAVMPADYEDDSGTKTASYPDPTPPPVTDENKSIQAPAETTKKSTNKVSQANGKKSAQEPETQKSRAAAVVTRNQNIKLAGAVVAFILIAVFFNRAQR